MVLQPYLEEDVATLEPHVAVMPPVKWLFY